MFSKLTTQSVSDRLTCSGLWDRSTGEGARGTILLGYNDVAPYQGDSKFGLRFTHGTEIQKEFKSELNNLSGVVPAEELVQFAWMAANVKYARKDNSRQGLNWLALHASAIDAGYYYYIPHKANQTGGFIVDENITPTWDKKTINLKNPVYRVPRAKFSQDPQDWRHNQTFIAEPVEIPGLDLEEN